MTNKSIRDILIDLANAQRGNMGNHDDYVELCSIQEAIQAIYQAIEEVMPKGKQGIKFHSGRQNSEMGAYSPRDNQKIGYNQALSSTIQALSKLFGREK